MGSCQCDGSLGGKKDNGNMNFIKHLEKKKKSEGCNVDLRNNDGATAYDYAYSKAIQDHLRGCGINMCKTPRLNVLLLL